MGSMSDPHAQIGDDVEVGAETRIWPFASVIRRAKIGRACNIASCAIVDGAVIGDRCLIGHGAQVHPGARLGNDVFVGPGAILCNDRWPRTGKADFDTGLLLRRELVTVDVADGASIGAGAIILPGAAVGSGAMIAAGAVVAESVPAGHLFKRNGSMVRIEPGRPPNRLRRAAAA